MIPKCLQANADQNRAHGRLVHIHFCLFLESPGPLISAATLEAYQFDLKVFSLSHIAVANGRQMWQSLYLNAEEERWQQPQEETSDRLFRPREAPLSSTSTETWPSWIGVTGAPLEPAFCSGGGTVLRCPAPPVAEWQLSLSQWLYHTPQVLFIEHLAVSLYMDGNVPSAWVAQDSLVCACWTSTPYG